MTLNIGILGYGEIGKSLHAVYKDFKNKFRVKIKDQNFSDDFSDLEVLNVCVPFKDESDFINVVTRAMKESKAKVTVIHSTTLPNVTNVIREKTQMKVVHSPVIGTHPNLYEALKTFVKYIGYENKDEKELAENHFNEIEIKCDSIQGSSNTELAKLYSTAYYGLCIAFHGEMKKHFDKENLNFNFIKKWNDTYNQGYEKLGKKTVTRPNLIPPENNKIGGHCVIPNAELLFSIFKSDALKFILQYK